jgi:hypothetical protein
MCVVFAFFVFCFLFWLFIFVVILFLKGDIYSFKLAPQWSIRVVPMNMVREMRGW